MGQVLELWVEGLGFRLSVLYFPPSRYSIYLGLLRLKSPFHWCSRIDPLDEYVLARLDAPRSRANWDTHHSQGRILALAGYWIYFQNERLKTF